MMQSTYLLEIQRNSRELRQNTKNLRSENKATEGKRTLEKLSGHYETVHNEDESEFAGVLTAPKDTETHDIANVINRSHSNKLRISLTAEKIALKSHSPQIDKSIAPRVQLNQRNDWQQKQQPIHQRGQEQSQGRQNNAPPTFTIVPINLSNNRSGFASRRRPTQGNETSDAPSNNLPEIVLTSFESRPKSTNICQIPVATRRASASVTFQRAPNFKPAEKNDSKISPNSTVNKNNSGSTSLPSPPAAFAMTLEDVEALNKSDSQIDHITISSTGPLTSTLTTVTSGSSGYHRREVVAEVHDHIRDTDTSSEFASQPDSSTSPESLMDNVLSAASSVSVRSSSSNSSDETTRQRSGSTGGNVGAVKGLSLPRRHIGGSASKLDELPANESSIATASDNAELQFSKVTPKRTKILNSLPRLGQLVPSAASFQTTPQLVALDSTTSQHLQALQASLFDACETRSLRSRSPSPSRSISICVTPDPSTIMLPDELKCQLCKETFQDPRTLNCLHSFCFQCLMDENYKQDASIPFWSRAATEDIEWKATKSICSPRSSSPEISVRSGSEPTSPSRSQRSSFSLITKKSTDRVQIKGKASGKIIERTSSGGEERRRFIICKICSFVTELPAGGLRQLPQNRILLRKLEEAKRQFGDEVIAHMWCNLCMDEINATYHCETCNFNLCTLCKECHERQRSTAHHKIRSISEMRQLRRQEQGMMRNEMAEQAKCGIHAGCELKAFCINCLQMICAECMVLFHKGHKYEPIARAIDNYVKLLLDSVDHTTPLCKYAEHSIDRLNELSKVINKKCNEVQADVERFMSQYVEAIEVHRKTLLQQVRRARESKMEMILEQQMHLEKRTAEAMEAVRFCQELLEKASDVEILAFTGVLLKRFEYCQAFKIPLDSKVSESLHFLPKIQAPCTKSQNNIPLYGIITMQTVEPAFCVLQWEGFTQLRLHKRTELTLLSRDADGVPLCHGGLQIIAHVKYKENHSRCLPVEISDQRDGTYIISFTPDAQGTIILTVSINSNPIKGSPFTFLARTVRPHSGVYHCCAFCSSKGSKSATCCCAGRMPGYNGCGHGHAGHPGRRHWSCCGNVLENSECNLTNKMLNS